MPAASDSTREALLNAARELAQTRGYNAFSFRDLSDLIGVKTASIHYHFPTKADLGRELVIRYREQLAELTRQIDARTSDPGERLDRFIAILRTGLKKGTRMCLGGMFGAEYSTLPGPVQSEVRTFFEGCESWLVNVLAAGRESGRFRFEGNPEQAAQALFASLEGAMMTARAFHDESRFVTAADLATRALSNHE
ncbi:HTH-type transcriptional repressor NemR [Phycisphaerales bacterium]|nr:HTH-type transcriptional repressor NemR [Phycisphaerales bacterium]